MWLHSIPVSVVGLLVNLSKTAQFDVVRYSLALLSFAADYLLYKVKFTNQISALQALRDKISRSIGYLYLFFATSASGTFVAS